MDRKAWVGIAVVCVVSIGLVAVYGVLSHRVESRLVVVFAGAASKPVLEEAAEAFKEKTGISVELHFGGSGTVLTQMKVSRTGDLYIPGSHDYMVRAIKDGAVHPETIKVLAYVVPAIIVQEGNPKNISSLEDLAKPGIKVGIGDPGSVCVGQYAVEILEYNGLREEVDKNIVVHAESCEKTAALVTLGQVDAVVGWSVFASWNPDKTDAVLIKPEGIPKISCIPGAVSTYSKNAGDAEEFLNFLASEPGQEVFRKHGYIATLEEARVYAPNAEVPEFYEVR